MLERAGIHYGAKDDWAGEVSFVLTAGPLVEASSVDQAAQRFERPFENSTL